MSHFKAQSNFQYLPLILILEGYLKTELRHNETILLDPRTSSVVVDCDDMSRQGRHFPYVVCSCGVW